MSMGDVADLPLKLLLRPDSQGQSKYYITILGAVWSTSLKIRGAGKCDKASCECRIMGRKQFLKERKMVKLPKWVRGVLYKTYSSLLLGFWPFLEDCLKSCQNSRKTQGNLNFCRKTWKTKGKYKCVRLELHSANWKTKNRRKIYCFAIIIKIFDRQEL